MSKNQHQFYLKSEKLINTKCIELIFKSYISASKQSRYFYCFKTTCTNKRSKRKTCYFCYNF